MSTEQRPESLRVAHQTTVRQHPVTTDHTPTRPAFPAQAMPWQPTSLRSPRTHQVPPELLR